MTNGATQREGVSRRRLLRAGVVLAAVGCFGGLNLPNRLPVLLLPYSAVAGETEETTNQATTGSKKGTSPDSKDKTVKKSAQNDVQSRGLFKKKKKKQKGGSASHSQASDGNPSN
jgi:hypothetical protein